RCADSVFAELVHRHDRRVLEACLNARFPHEAIAEIARELRGGANALDRDLSPEQRIARRNYLAHATVTELADQLVALRWRRRILVVRARERWTDPNGVPVVRHWVHYARRSIRSTHGNLVRGETLHEGRL